MALATAEAIRDRIYNLIEALTPTTDATRFRRYRNEWGADFIAAAEANPAAMLRRVQVREVSDDEPPVTTGVIEERVTVRYQVLIAYPLSHRYGRDNAVDRDDVMNEDWKAINFKVGIYGRGNFSTSTDGSYDATPLGAVRDMERGDGVDLLVIDVPFEFYRATGVETEEDEEPVVTWTVDATSGKAVPANATEWADFIAAKGLSIAVPDYLHLCQEASGNLADSIGSLTLAANGAPLYQQSITGWSRVGVKGTNTATGQRFMASASSTASTPYAILCLVQFDANQESASPGSREIFGVGASSDWALAAYDDGGVTRIRYTEGSNTADTSAANDYSSACAVAGLNDASGRARVFTSLETLSPTYGAPASNNAYFLGSRTMRFAAATIGYSCGWKAAISDADMQALIEALEW